MIPLGPDIHSYSNFPEIAIKHLSFNLTVDFNRKILYGFIDYTVHNITPPVAKIDLDFRGVAIEKVVLLTGQEETPLSYTVPQTHATLGHAIQIYIPMIHQFAKTYTFRIYSSTTSLSGGIQWFDPCQTLGKIYPFMYTQFEAILARTMFPCQDTPSVKSTYEIRIKVPAPLVAACSGSLVGKTESEEELLPYGINLKYITYHFEQKVPIPSYLIAIAVGDLERGQIGPRSFVWCEREILDAAKYEYDETEKFIRAGEKICGIPYSWGTYDILMLPGAFPYGGMENPNLTFVNSCLLTGDKSLTDVIAHEITHSWAGNLVTNASWSDFWLNEGFTMYIERLILGECSGEEYRHFSLASGYALLQKTCIELKGEPEFTKLNQYLPGVDPDEAFSRIPYEKGCLFLFFLEILVGGKEKMVEWLQSYFKDFYQKCVSWKQMAEHFEKHFKDVKVDWEEWMHGPGLPKWDPLPYLKEKISEKAIELSKIWLKMSGAGATENDLAWKPEQTMLFLDLIINSGEKLPAEIIEKMDSLYQLTQNNNIEVLFRWLLICLENHYVKNFARVEDVLSKNGRGVYVKPMYSKLVELSKKEIIPTGKAKEIYVKNKSYYHYVIRSFVEGILNSKE